MSAIPSWLNWGGPRNVGYPLTREGLRASRQAIEARLVELNVLPKSFVKPEDGENVAKVAIRQLEEREAQCHQGFQDLVEYWVVAGQEYRQYQLDHGLTRSAKQPNLTATSLTIYGAFLVETAMTSVLMVSDGKMAVTAGVAYGATVAFLNLTVSLITGYFAGRHLGYGADAPVPKPKHRTIRRLAKIGFGVGFCTLGALHFGAARTRALGTHEDIFNFIDVPLVDTFGSYFALAILVAGVAGAILGIWKGWTGLDDAYPGYGAAYRTMEKDVRQRADEHRDRLLDQVDEVFETADERLKDFVADIEEYNDERRELTVDLLNGISKHNQQVDTAKDAKTARALAETKRAARIAGREPEPSAPDLAGFDQLRINTGEVPGSGDDEDPSSLIAARDALGAQYERCISTIEDAHADFGNRSPDTPTTL